MPYTADKPQPASPDEPRARIPGWGVDLDPKDRPSVPKLRYDPGATGAHWDFPERQPGHEERERSIEHKFVTPVFGTSMPLKGLSGKIRSVAYRYSEARAAHWLILLAGDRVDAWEGHVASLLRGRPDNPITETGVRAELSHHGVRSRFGRGRADVNHQWIDPIVVAGPWVLVGAGAFAVIRRVARMRRR